MDTLTTPTKTVEEISPPPSPEVQTPEVSPEIQTIIDCYEEANTFATNFYELETSSTTDDDPKYQQPPWKDVKKNVDRDIRQTAYIMRSLNPDNTLTPEELGLQLFKVRDKFNKDHVPKGSIRAELHGPCIVMICDNEEDFNIITNHEQEEEIQGSFKIATYRLLRDGQSPDVRPQIPTITVLQTPQTNEDIEHEKVHYRLKKFMPAARQKDAFLPVNARFTLNEAFDEFATGQIDEAKIEQAIQTYVRSQRIRAIEEFIVESVAQGKIDNRDMYGTYCEDGKLIAKDYGQKYLDMVGFEEHELGKEIQQIKQRYDRTARFLIASGVPPSEAYMSLGMSLMTTDEQRFTQALDGFDLMFRISLNQDMSDLRQDFNPRKQYLDMDMIATTFTDAVDKTQAQTNFGFQKALKSGMSLPEALREATKNREHFLQLTKPIQDQIDIVKQKESEKEQRMNDEWVAQEQRQIIAEEIISSSPDKTALPAKAEPNVSAKPQEGPITKILNRLMRFGG